MMVSTVNGNPYVCNEEGKGKQLFQTLSAM